ncbi:hypothetical protein Btru_077446 [Bulinus truncatus]|nr:hypothetical protein Btru_077446 [Bulinus truncatus]
MESSKLANEKSKSQVKADEIDLKITVCDTTTQIENRHSDTLRRHGVQSDFPRLSEANYAHSLHLMQRLHPLGGRSDKWREAALGTGDDSDYSLAHEHRLCLPPFEGYNSLNHLGLIHTDKKTQGLRTSSEEHDGDDGDHVSRKRHFEEVDSVSDSEGSDTHPTQGSRSRVPEHVRLRINSRERQRMHDLNSALDSLRQVMPYTSGSSVKKLSKMSTLLLARNYIVTLTRSLDELKRLVQELMLLQPARFDKRAAAAYDVTTAASAPQHPVATSPSSMKPAIQPRQPFADSRTFTSSMKSKSAAVSPVPASNVAPPPVPSQSHSAPALPVQLLPSPTATPAPGLPMIGDPALYASWVASSASLLRGAHVAPHSGMFHPACLTYGAPVSIAPPHTHIHHSSSGIMSCHCVQGRAVSEMTS